MIDVDHLQPDSGGFAQLLALLPRRWPASGGGSSRGSSRTYSESESAIGVENAERSHCSLSARTWVRVRYAIRWAVKSDYDFVVEPPAQARARRGPGERSPTHR